MAVAVKKSLAGKNGERIMDNEVKKVDTPNAHWKQIFLRRRKVDTSHRTETKHNVQQNGKYTPSSYLESPESLGPSSYLSAELRPDSPPSKFMLKRCLGSSLRYHMRVCLCV